MLPNKFKPVYAVGVRLLLLLCKDRASALSELRQLCSAQAHFLSKQIGGRMKFYHHADRLAAPQHFRLLRCRISVYEEKGTSVGLSPPRDIVTP